MGKKSEEYSEWERKSIVGYSKIFGIFQVVKENSTVMSSGILNIFSCHHIIHEVPRFCHDMQAGTFFRGRRAHKIFLGTLKMAVEGP